MNTPDRRTTRARRAGVPLLLLCAVVLVACGGLTPLSDVLDGPAESDGASPSGVAQTSSPSGAATGEPDDRDGEKSTVEPVVYTWALPPDPETPSLNDDGAYEALRVGDCDTAAFDITTTDTHVPNYRSWSSPRAVVLTAAGVAYCRGDAQLGRALTEQAIDDYGTDGLGPEKTPWCRLYRALRSVTEQRPAESFECRGSYWPDGPEFTVVIDAAGAEVWDDPLTAEDETLTVAPSPSPSPSPSESASPSPSPSPSETSDEESGTTG